MKLSQSIDSFVSERDGRSEIRTLLHIGFFCLIVDCVNVYLI